MLIMENVDWKNGSNIGLVIASNFVNNGVIFD